MSKKLVTAAAFSLLLGSVMMTAHTVTSAQASSTFAQLTPAPIRTFAQWTFDNSNENWLEYGFIEELEKGVWEITIPDYTNPTGTPEFTPYFLVNQNITVPAGQKFINFRAGIHASQDISNLHGHQTMSVQYRYNDGTVSPEVQFEIEQANPNEFEQISAFTGVTSAKTITQVKIKAIAPNYVFTEFNIDTISITDKPIYPTEHIK